MRGILSGGTVTLFASMVLGLFLVPFLYMMSTAFKDREQIANFAAPKTWPAREETFEYQGEALEYPFTFTNALGMVVTQTLSVVPGEEYPIYKVPVGEGDEVRDLAIVAQRPDSSFFVDPEDPDAGLIQWQGKWQTLKRSWEFSPAWSNFTTAWTEINFPRLLRNTLIIAVLGDIGTLLSCILVAYGFSRFRIPGKSILFTILIATILLPGQVLLVPTYAFYTAIGWTGTFLPLIVPHFFANAYNVFLLRQYFMTIPKEMDEAAMIDGASPFRTLLWVILPQAVPAIISVALFHFMWAWNEFFNTFIYLSGRPELQPISVGIYAYNAMYFARPHMIQATALMGLVLPVAVFFLAQGVFMRGVVMTGVEK